MLDVEDPISGEYTLEVSSPGMDRLLFKLGALPPYAGNGLSCACALPLRVGASSRDFKGIEGEDVVVQVDDHEYLLPSSALID